MKEKIAEERKLRKLWQTNRCPIMKNKLNRAIKALINLLDSERNQGIQEYLSKLSATSETNYSLWKATKKLKRPQTQYLPIRKQDGSWARSERQGRNSRISPRFLRRQLYFRHPGYLQDLLK